MNVLGIVSVIVGTVSAFAAAVAVLVSLITWKESKRLAAWTMNFTHLVDAERMLSVKPELLEFHGITKDMMNQCNATPEEIVYLLSSFRAGQEWTKLTGRDAHKLSAYRKNMLDNEKVVNIWQNILYEKIIHSGPFVRAVNQYL